MASVAITLPPRALAPALHNTAHVVPPHAYVAVAQTVAPAQAIDEKDSRTPAERKINSQLLYEIYRLQGKADEKHVPPGATGVKIDAKKRALVDLRADVTPALEKELDALGSAVVSTSLATHSIIAWIPLLKLEGLAGDAVIRAIEPAAESIRLR